MSLERFEAVGRIQKALGNEKRVRVFGKLAEGESVEEIQAETGLSRSGLQNYIGDFKDESLLARGDEGYELTELGESWYELLAHGEDLIVRWRAENFVEQFEQEVGADHPAGREAIEKIIEKYGDGEA